MAAPEHWITDIYSLHPLNPHAAYPANSYMSTNHQAVFYLFHLLRLMGWKLIAECDHYTLTCHVTDGNMETAGVANWSAIGTATREKSAANFHDGSQSLTFTTLASGDGIQSANFTVMAASGAYRLSFWAYNNCGHNLTCYIDNGNGSWTLLGTITSNGAWTRYDWGYTAHSTVTAVRFRVLDEAGTVSAGQVYIDTVYTSLSYYEHTRDGAGTDGVIETGNNTFSSASYAFTSADVAASRKLIVYDPTNPGNSGVYTIIGLDGSKAIVELRCTGTYYLTAATGLAFRVVTPTPPGTYNTSGGAVFWSDSYGAGNGFILESPHSSAWRLKIRNYWKYSGGFDTLRANCRWASSPGPCEFDIETFRFYKKQRSTSRNILPDTTYSYNPTDVHGSRAADHRDSGNGRFSAMIADDGSYIFLLFRTTAGYNDAALIGYMGDNYLPDADTFVHIQGGGANWDYVGNWLLFTAASATWNYWGCSFESEGLAYQTSIGSTGWGTSTSMPEGASNAKANPFSSEEYVRPLFFFCDWPGMQGRFRTIESQIETIGHCRQNLPTFAPFGSSLEWFHAAAGLCFKWHGRQVIA